MVSTGILYVLLLICGFIVTFGVLEKKGFLKKYGLEFSTPILFWKTQRGKDLIEYLSRKKRFWELYGNMSIVVLGISMVAIFGLVVWSAYLASQIPSEQAPSPRLIIGIPGVNPLIPVWYGILGLATAIIVHEFSHGILARVGDIKIKTLGLIFLVVPLGAFVEPDEEEMEKMPKLKRDRIYSVGPTTNIILALVCVLLFTSLFMGAVEPVNEGVIVNGIVSDSPAHLSDVSWGELITEIDGREVRDMDDFTSLDVEPGRDVEVRSLREKEEVSRHIYAGVVVSTVLKDYPAHEGGLRGGDVMISMDGANIRNMDDFQRMVDASLADQRVNIVYHRWNGTGYVEHSTNVTLADKYEGYAKHYPHENKDEYRGKGYLGLGTSYMGLSVWDVDLIPRMMSSPYGGRISRNMVQSTLFFISYPFLGLSPLPSEITSLYQVTGPLSALPSRLFWVTANSLYWVFWLNLMVGLFNALPAIPLDGGFVFRDGLNSLLEKLGYKNEKIVDKVVYVLALTILALIVWQLVGPRI